MRQHPRPPKRSAAYLKYADFRGLKVKDVLVSALDRSDVLGVGIDVMALPEGHLVCNKCKKHKFECWIYGDNYVIEMGCMECGESYRLLFPIDAKLPDKAGRFTCLRHPGKGMILIHNTDVIGIGCESCFTEIRICLRKAKGIVLAS
jgi:hypothetical protein